MIKKIHQIWIGGKPLPKKYKDYSDRLKNLNPSYEYTLWTDNDFLKYVDDKELQHWIISIDVQDTKSLVSITNFLRCWVLNKFGGWYFDTDMEFFKPLDDLPFQSDHIFSKHSRPPYNSYEIFNCCFYCIPNSIFLRHAMDNVQKDEFSVNSFAQAYKDTKHKINSIVLDEEYLISTQKRYRTDKTIAFHYADHTWKK